MDAGMGLGEERIKVLHSWISRLCDPDSNFCEFLMKDFETTCQSIDERNFEGGGGLYTELANRKIDTSKLTGVLGLEKENEIKDGPLYIKHGDGTVFEGNYKRGVPHGYFRHINQFGDVDFFCCFVRGIVHGMCWKGLVGGGFLVSPTWDFTSDRVVYLYPDCRTALIGNFLKGEMVSAQLAEVIGSSASCSYFCGSMKPELSPARGSFYSYDQSTADHLSSNPSLQDPYEVEFVEVKPSSIPKAGEGLFARVDIEVGTVLSFYNGLRLEVDGREDLDEYRIILDECFDLSIPMEMASLEKYSASLAHKVCHSFTPNAEFDTFYHPRFGLIRCLASVADIRKGEEITVNYRYRLNIAPDWYKVSWAKHQKLVRGLPDWNLAVSFSRISRGRASLGVSESSVISLSEIEALILSEES